MGSGLFSFRWATRAMAAGGLAAAVTLTGWCAEPSYFTEEEVAGTTPTQSSVTQETSQATVLRWKTSRIASRSDSHSQAIRGQVIAAGHNEPVATSSGLRPAFKAPARPGSWNTSKLGSAPNPLVSTDGTIRLMAYDPHSDPFGDRVAQAGREPALAAPANGAKADQAEAAPMPEKPMSSARPMVNPLPNPMEKPLPREEEANPKPMPMPGEPPAAVDYYNFRDCAKSGEGCKLFKETLLGSPISQISLNIMPRYKPDAKSKQEDDVERETQLAQSVSRDWRDQKGRLLGTGKLADLRDNKVILTDEMGKEVARLDVNNLGADELCFLAGWWRLPPECPVGEDVPVARDWIPSTFTWTASAICHKPLYFEEVQLERYGHTAGPFKQPWISGAHFFFNIAVLPYKMAINPPMECQYPLGYYRPGNCAPWHIPPIPLSLRGAVAETAVWVGGIYIIP